LSICVQKSGLCLSVSLVFELINQIKTNLRLFGVLLRSRLPLGSLRSLDRGRRVYVNHAADSFVLFWLRRNSYMLWHSIFQLYASLAFDAQLNSKWNLFFGGFSYDNLSLIGVRGVGREKTLSFVNAHICGSLSWGFPESVLVSWVIIDELALVEITNFQPQMGWFSSTQKAVDLLLPHNHVSLCTFIFGLIVSNKLG